MWGADQQHQHQGLHPRSARWIFQVRSPKQGPGATFLVGEVSRCQGQNGSLGFKESSDNLVNFMFLQAIEADYSRFENKCSLKALMNFFERSENGIQGFFPLCFTDDRRLIYGWSLIFFLSASPPVIAKFRSEEWREKTKKTMYIKIPDHPCLRWS